ncbi:MAG: MerR family transcriptional regulator [Polaribacter sp.]|nr:MerR family transcriptional regulator [Polaribacter sp.]MDG1810483.1 MerR family transcriptional regulator [Polaribacter sp.]MDG1994797.1 MerR family transcriptional regulator [Polaribacter sp.]
MNNIKTDFTIKDLENLTGIKAHTIRIWEKRYQLLTPKRTNGNIRYYDTKNLQKLLNVSLLNKNNYKISKIAELSEEAIILMSRELANKNALIDDSINSFKMAMFTFDQALFNQTYNQLLINKTFRDVFKDVFIPFLEQIGLMWQTDTLTPSHERFISNLISQKIQINSEKTQQNLLVDESQTYVLFLPDNEIHELGLMYLNYELSLRGKKTIYLGQSIPLNSLNSLLAMFSKITFVTSFTVSPVDSAIEDYLKDVDERLAKTKHEFWVYSHRISGYNPKNFKSTFFFYNSLFDLLKKL